MLSLLFVIVIALLWEPSLPAENIALQFPVVLDLRSSPPSTTRCAAPP